LVRGLVEQFSPPLPRRFPVERTRGSKLIVVALAVIQILGKVGIFEVNGCIELFQVGLLRPLYLSI
jgi:hypothetical protein